MFTKIKNWFSPAPLSTGERGEQEAADYLQQEKGFRIIERNWRSGKDEIDLIAYEKEILVFVEVKTRRKGGLVPGYYSVDKRKKKALKRAMRAYMRQYKQPPNTYRLDVVEVNKLLDGGWEVLHFSNIPISKRKYS